MRIEEEDLHEMPMDDFEAVHESIKDKRVRALASALASRYEERPELVQEYRDSPAQWSGAPIPGLSGAPGHRGTRRTAALTREPPDPHGSLVSGVWGKFFFA
jgi:hypothetical protein